MTKKILLGAIACGFLVTPAHAAEGDFLRFGGSPDSMEWSVTAENAFSSEDGHTRITRGGDGKLCFESINDQRVQWPPINGTTCRIKDKPKK